MFWTGRTADCYHPPSMKSAMFSLGALLLVAAAFPCQGQNQVHTQNQVQAQKSTSEYAGLRDRVKSGDLSVDFKRLRIAYVSAPEYHEAKDTEKETTAMIAAVNARDFKLAIQNADVVLENNYTDMDAHFVEYIAYRELGNAAQAGFHRSVFDGLIRSILNSGDGKSRETAYVVALVHEEYVVLRVLGLRPDKQSLDQDKEHSYDVLETKDPESGKAVKLYFNVDVSMNHLMNIFGDKK